MLNDWRNAFIFEFPDCSWSFAVLHSLPSCFFPFKKFVCLFHLFTLHFSPKVPGKFRPKLNKTGKQQQERCFSCVACESLKLTTHSSYSAHQKELKFLMESQTFPILFLQSLVFCSSLWPALKEAFTNVILFQTCFKCEFNTLHLDILFIVFLSCCCYFLYLTFWVIHSSFFTVKNNCT